MGKKGEKAKKLKDIRPNEPFEENGRLEPQNERVAQQSKDKMDQPQCHQIDPEFKNHQITVYNKIN